MKSLTEYLIGRSSATIPGSIIRLSFIFFAIAFVILLSGEKSYGQAQIVHVSGTPCVGQNLTFTLAKNCSSITWSAHPTGSATIVSNFTGAVVVRWNVATTNAYVSAVYSGCSPAPSSGSSSSTPMTISAAVTPSVSISINGSTSFCAGTNVTFTATPINGGSNPQYTWRINGTSVSGSGNTLTRSNLSNGDVIQATLSSNAQCAAPATATSNSITVNVIQPTPVNVTVSGSTTVCPTQGNGFTASVNNAMPEPPNPNCTYTWYKNDVETANYPGMPASVFFAPANSLNNNDRIKCKVTATGCFSGSPAWSNELTVTTTPPDPQPVGISPSPLSICQGENITFTPSSGGTLSNYQWRLNGNLVGTNSTYTTNQFTSESVVTLTVNVSGICSSSSTATATTAGIPIVVHPNVTPLVSITTPTASICAGTSVVFTAAPVHGGSPTYAWKINGSTVSSGTDNTFTRSNLNNTDAVSVVMTSTATCRTASTAPSNSITMSVTPITSLSVVVSGNVSVCSNQSVAFTALVNNETPEPPNPNYAFTWYKYTGTTPTENDAVPDNPNTPDFVYAPNASSLNSNDKIKCKVTAVGCYSPNVAWSNEKVMTVIPMQTFSVSAIPSKTELCPAESITFTANANFPVQSYQWQMNGSPVPLATGNSFITTASSVTQLQSVKVTVIAATSSTQSPHCASNTTATSVNVQYISFTIVSTDPPATPLISSNPCGAKTLSKNGTPPSGVSWFWQGTDQNGVDHTSATATASTYTTANTNGATNYYIKARNNTYGCWSPHTTIPVTVDNPSTPNANSLQYCEWNPLELTTTGYSSTLKWYTAGDSYITSGTTYTPTDLNIGSYTYKVKNVSPAGCESAGTAAITLTVKSDCDDHMNWGELTTYTVNEAGNTIPFSASRSYSDGFGNVLQSQGKSFGTNTVFATENIFDTYGSPSLSTLPAPTNSSTFVYRYRFVTNNLGKKYTAADFDSPATLNNPSPVGDNGPGTLGWYYSSSNNLEPLTPVTSFPYARSYTPPGPDPTTSKSAGAGDAHRMGAGHEVSSERQPIGPNDLTHYLDLRFHFVQSSLPVTGYKFITTDPDGKKVVNFVDADGRGLASATLSEIGYANWSYSYYNDLGQLVASVAPEGVVVGDYTFPSFVTSYKYDYLGRLIETTSPDEGTSRFAYSLDGKIRFSQNQEQYNSNPKRFSYTNYDYLGRSVESGEYTSTSDGYVFEPQTANPSNPLSILHLVDINIARGYDVDDLNASIDPAIFKGPSAKIDIARCSDYTFIKYDRPASAPAAQENLDGQVSKTENANTFTWYSYDEFGQLIKIWQRTKNSAIANPEVTVTVNYTYDYFGNVTQVYYQGNHTTDKFYHHYVYNSDNRLKEVYTSKDGTTKTLHAQYEYYLHGRLKRVVLANNLQGIDYTYTIDGALKSINHADPAKDPGGDGTNDVFGETLHYYDGDYQGAGYNAGTQTISGHNNQFGGLLKAMSWHSPAGNHTKQTYAYQYNNLNFLTNAVWGNMTGTSGSYTFSPSGEAYREAAANYDKNGNIGTMLRKGKEANTLANYSYVYEPNTNKLDKVNNNSVQMLDYTYNAIGQMIKQNEDEKEYEIYYNAYGLVKEIKKVNESSTVTLQTYHYDDRGNLFQKVLHDNSGVPQKYITYISDAAGNILAIYEQSGTTVLTSQPLEISIYGAGRIAVYKPEVNTYFYEVNDHLGNVRAVIGAPATETVSTNFETEADNEFQNYSRHDDNFMDHSDAGTVYKHSQILTSGYSSQIGLARSFEVSPGDIVRFEAYSKYRNLDTNADVDLSTFTASLLGAFELVPGSPGDPGLAYNALEDYGTVIAGGHDHSDYQNIPKAYLNILLFDKNYRFVDAAYKQIIGAQQTGTSVNMPFDPLICEITVGEPGYAYLFLSNENLKRVDVHFDDVTISHIQSPIVAGSDYYPFGLAMENREITDEPYRYGYQGQFSERNDSTRWNEFELRLYDARIGRWLSVDPYGQYVSPYLAMGNTPHMSVDPTGGIDIDLPVVVIEATRLPAYVLVLPSLTAGIRISGNIPGYPRYSPHFQATPVEHSELYKFFMGETAIVNSFLHTISFGRWPKMNVGREYKLQQEMGEKAGIIAQLYSGSRMAPTTPTSSTVLMTTNGVNVTTQPGPFVPSVNIQNIHGNRNGHLAGNTHPDTDVPFDSDGFPDFSDHLYKGGPNDVMIKPTGDRTRDYAAANLAAGYKNTPKNYTWHHHQTRGRMQLVKTKVHAKTGHTGGFALWD